MILARLDQAAAYESLNPHFAAAFEYLRRPDVATLAIGRYAVTDAVAAIVTDEPGRGQSGARMEVHRQTIDIQYCVAGEDLVGWKPAADLRLTADDYNPAKDTQKFYDEPVCWVPLPQGCFQILFPEDGHAPLGAEGALLKVVVKIPVA